MPDPMDGLNAALGGRYVLERKLGEGGMATVYLARDVKHGREVAVKVLKEHEPDEVAAARFHREIEIAARLNHPHIIPLHDSGEADGHLFFVMPNVTGDTLQARLRSGPLPLDQVSDFAADLAAGLDYAHAHGVIHRDLKPSNILIHEGEALIADMGIATHRRQEDKLHLTQTGTSIGTPAYMSPEQLTGEREIDSRSDVYSLGCVIYEMVAGQPPFSAATPEALVAKALTERPPPVSSLVSNVDHRLDAVLAKSLAKKPEERFRSAGDLADEIARVLRPAAEAPRTGRRALAGSVLVAAAIVAVLGWVLVKREALARGMAMVDEVDSLFQAGAAVDAFVLGSRVRGREPLAALESIRPYFAAKEVLTSTPPGAAVSWRPYASPSEPWRLLGVTPTDSVWLPREMVSYRLDLEGYDPLFVNQTPYEAGAGFFLRPAGSVPEGSVWIPGAVVDLGDHAAGLFGVEPLELGSFLADRFEVTNAHYKRFLADGGYETPAYWLEEMEVGDRLVTPAEVPRVFVDRTGRPGPSTWEQGDYAEGEGDYPVTGVSWYEARAYAEYAGKRLPTIYHWYRAASTWESGRIIPRSNLAGSSLLPVGATQAESQFGLKDMAGNAREWVSTSNGVMPYMLGGRVERSGRGVRGRQPTGGMGPLRDERVPPDHPARGYDGPGGGGYPRPGSDSGLRFRRSCNR